MLAEPRRSVSRHARLVGQTEETYTPESDLDAIQKACQGLVRGEAPVHEFDGVITAAEQAAAEPEVAEVAAEDNYLPGKQVSPDPWGIPEPASQPAVPQTIEAAAAGDIQRYRDAEGVLTYRQCRPEPADPEPARQPRRGFSKQCWLSRGAASADMPGWSVRLKRPILPNPI